MTDRLRHLRGSIGGVGGRFADRFRSGSSVDLRPPDRADLDFDALMQDPDESVRLAAIRNRNCPHMTVRWALLFDGSHRVRLAALEHRTIMADDATQALNDSHRSVRDAAGRHPLLPDYLTK